MLDPSWESYATTLSNATTDDALLSALQAVIIAFRIDLSKPSHVVYGRDTRPTGPELVTALEAGLGAMTGPEKRETWENKGVLTTPVLHYIVRGLNCEEREMAAYGAPNLEGYLDKTAEAFCKLMVNLPRDPW